jgi:hypothetical protein
VDRLPREVTLCAAFAPNTLARNSNSDLFCTNMAFAFASTGQTFQAHPT